MKKIVLRKCIATNEQCEKKDLLRIVRTPSKNVEVDLTGKANGRGAYLKKDIAALEICIKRNSLKRALECDISEEVYLEIRKVING